MSYWGIFKQMGTTNPQVPIPIFPKMTVSFAEEVGWAAGVLGHRVVISACCHLRTLCGDSGLSIDSELVKKSKKPVMGKKVSLLEFSSTTCQSPVSTLGLPLNFLKSPLLVSA